MNKFLFIISFLLIFFSCDSKVNDGSKLEKSFEIGELDKLLEGINLPEGFTIEIYADNISNARSMDISPSGTIFIGNRHDDNVFAIRDEDGDNIAEKKWLITNKLKNMPNGVAFHKGDLYVAEVDKLWVFKNIEDNLENPGTPILIYDDYPKDKHHGWK